jgi:hypothetical protein
MLQRTGVATGGRVLAKQHSVADRIAAAMPAFRAAVPKHVAAIESHHDGNPMLLAELESAIRQTNDSLDAIAEYRREGPDRKRLLAMRTELLALRDALHQRHRRAHPGRGDRRVRRR